MRTVSLRQVLFLCLLLNMVPKAYGQQLSPYVQDAAQDTAAEVEAAFQKYALIPFKCTIAANYIAPFLAYRDPNKSMSTFSITDCHRFAKKISKELHEPRPTDKECLVFLEKHRGDLEYVYGFVYPVYTRHCSSG